jgi:hypothetical protein
MLLLSQQEALPILEIQSNVEAFDHTGNKNVV